MARTKKLRTGNAGVGMRAAEDTGRAGWWDGAVVRVDMVNRELTVHFADGPGVIDVPPGCPITLRGERVRLRMLQPGDLVRVTYTDRRGSWVAAVVEVRSGRPVPGPPSRLDSARSLANTSPTVHPPHQVGGVAAAGQ
jgi:hypothetical protein